MTERTVYLDNSATTPLSEAARAAMLAAMDSYGNPSSLHTLGQQSEQLVRHAREQLLGCLGVRPRQGTLVFTSCGTEATALALFGTAYAKARRDATRILTTDSEHPATARALDALEKNGFEIVRIPTVGGVLDTDALCAALDRRIFLASFMLVNNETGALYRLKEAFSLIKRAYPDAITHCDAVQGFMRVRFTPQSLGADMISLSAHKIHAPKGVGALYIDGELLKRKKIVPYLVGGGQESGMRSGTENVIGISAFGAAAEDMNCRREQTEQKLSALYEYASKGLEKLELTVNRPREAHVSHIINFTLPDIKSETMLHYLSADGIYVSSGSACSSHSGAPSSTLMAFGLTPHMADCSLRISFSEYNTAADIDALCKSLRNGLEGLVRIKR